MIWQGEEGECYIVQSVDGQLVSGWVSSWSPRQSNKHRFFSSLAHPEPRGHEAKGRACPQGTYSLDTSKQTTRRQPDEGCVCHSQVALNTEEGLADLEQRDAQRAGD